MTLWSAIHQRFGMDVRVIAGFVTQDEAGDWINEQPNTDEWAIDDDVVSLVPFTNVGPVKVTPEEFASLYVGMDDEWRERSDGREQTVPWLYRERRGLG